MLHLTSNFKATCNIQLLIQACPDNPKGLYPKGGGCVFCGSVEHLKRDCPRKVEKDMAQGVRVGTITNDLEEEPMMHVGKVKKIKEKKVGKVVAFWLEIELQTMRGMGVIIGS